MEKNVKHKEALPATSGSPPWITILRTRRETKLSIIWFIQPRLDEECYCPNLSSALNVRVCRQPFKPQLNKSQSQKSGRDCTRAQHYRRNLRVEYSPGINPSPKRHLPTPHAPDLAALCQGLTQGEIEGGPESSVQITGSTDGTRQTECEERKKHHVQLAAVIVQGRLRQRCFDRCCC